MTRTDGRTDDILTPWAPVGAKKCYSSYRKLNTKSLFVRRHGVPTPVPRYQGRLHGARGLRHAEADPVMAVVAIGLGIRHIIVGVKPLDPVGPAAGEEGGRPAAGGLEHAGQLAVAVVRDPRGVTRVAVVAGVRTEARPRPPLTQMYHLWSVC